MDQQVHESFTFSARGGGSSTEFYYTSRGRSSLPPPGPLAQHIAKNPDNSPLLIEFRSYQWENVICIHICIYTYPFVYTYTVCATVYLAAALGQRNY